jgi:hypothetical protein
MSTLSQNYLIKNYKYFPTMSKMFWHGFCSKLCNSNTKFSELHVEKFVSVLRLMELPAMEILSCTCINFINIHEKVMEFFFFSRTVDLLL